MRDIKFRAWDKRTKRLYQVQALQFYGENNKVDACWTNGVDFDGESTLGEPELNNLHNLVLMQYTGKKDINGVEIYEGDIVMEMKSGDVFEVKYGWFENLSVIYLPEMGAYLYDGYETRPIYRLNYEVIGNVHTNPEMLEDYQ